MPLDRWHLLSCHYLWMHIKTSKEGGIKWLFWVILSLMLLRKQETTLSGTEHKCQWLLSREGGRWQNARLSLYNCKNHLAHVLSHSVVLNSSDYSPPDFSVHEILQARILEWVAISSSRGSFQPRGQTCISCIGRWVLYYRATWEASKYLRITLAHVFWRFILCYQLPS